MKIAIIGAGAGGLAAAHDLAKVGHSIEVFEAGPEVGGLAAGFKDPTWAWTLEKFYHHWFHTDTDILYLLDEIGRADKVRFLSPTTSYYRPGGNFALDKPFLGSGLLGRVVNILSMPGLSLPAKLRFGLGGLYLTLYRDGIALENVTADAWSRRWVGEEAHNLIWRPMLIGKFGPLYDSVNMAWLWARLHKRTAKLGTYEGGFQAALEDIAEAARQQGASIRLNAPVRSVTPAPGGCLTLEAEQAGGVYDVVLSTTSPALMAKLAPALPDAYREQLGALRSLGAMIVVLALERSLMQDGTYWLNLPAVSPEKDQNPFPFLALVEHTNYLPREHYNGDHILYLGDYLAPDHPYFSLSDDEVAALYLPSLRRVNPEFSTEWIRRRWVFRAPYAQPVPLLNHSQRLPDIRTPLSGLYFASMSQVYPWDRGTNYAVEIGRRAARMILQDRA